MLTYGFVPVTRVDGVDALHWAPRFGTRLWRH